MTTENKGTLKIEFADQGEPIIVFQPIEGTVWMNKPELIELFDITMSALNSHIKAVYQSQAFKYEDTAVYSLQTNGKEIRYEATEFNLSVIAALAFRVNSPQARLLREWLIKKVIKGHLCVDFPIGEGSERDKYRLN